MQVEENQMKSRKPTVPPFSQSHHAHISSQAPCGNMLMLTEEHVKNQKNHAMGTVYMKQGCEILESGNVTFPLCPLAHNQLKMFSNSFRRSREVWDFQVSVIGSQSLPDLSRGMHLLLSWLAVCVHSALSRPNYYLLSIDLSKSSF